jgi:hypothetical protein
MAIRPARSTASVALSLALAAFASGCGSEREKPAAPTPAAVPTPPPAAQQGAPQAAAVPEAAAPDEVAPTEEPTADYPSDFQRDVPRYPGSKVTSARGSADDGFAVTIDAPEGVEVVAKFFGDGLTASGWQTVVQAMPEGTMIIAEKGGIRAQGLVHEGGQGALVDLIVGPPE